LSELAFIATPTQAGIEVQPVECSQPQVGVSERLHLSALHRTAACQRIGRFGVERIEPIEGKYIDGRAGDAQRANAYIGTETWPTGVWLIRSRCRTTDKSGISSLATCILIATIEA